MSEFIDVKIEDKVCVIRMNRPEKKNAITSDMYQGLADALRQAFGDDAVNIITIFGVPGSFSAGNDLADFLNIDFSGDRSGLPVFDFLETIITAPKPIVAGVDGLAIGVGTTMLFHCDYVVASDQSLFKTPFVDLALLPEAGSSRLAPRIMGYHKAFELLVMGENFSAADANAAGLVNRVTSSDDVEKTALQKAAALAAKPQEALKISRELVRGDRLDIIERMREEAVLFTERLQSAEAKAAFASFFKK